MEALLVLDGAEDAQRGVPATGVVPGLDPLEGVLLAQQHDEWAEGRRYLRLEVLARSQAATHSTDEEVTDELTLQAITA